MLATLSPAQRPNRPYMATRPTGSALELVAGHTPQGVPVVRGLSGSPHLHHLISTPAAARIASVDESPSGKEQSPAELRLEWARARATRYGFLDSPFFPKTDSETLDIMELDENPLGAMTIEKLRDAITKEVVKLGPITVKGDTSPTSTIAEEFVDETGDASLVTATSQADDDESQSIED